MHATRAAEILDVNHAWQTQLIEAFGICPYARRCRQEGKLHRQVLEVQEDDLIDVLAQSIAAVHLRHEDIPEVALLICPDAPKSPKVFERMVWQAAAKAEDLARTAGGSAQFHVVAFHPDLAFDPETPAKLVAFWRRSPHPTVQMVHAATLQGIKGPPAPHYVDPEDIVALGALLGEPLPLDVADRIALANWRTWHSESAAIGPVVAKFRQSSEAERTDALTRQ